MNKKYARVVDVPEVEKAAYDHDRLISGLVMYQLIHLSAAEHRLPERHRSKINISRLHTEREASEYIRRVTAKLHRLPSRKKKLAGKARKPKTSAKRKQPTKGKRK